MLLRDRFFVLKQGIMKKKILIVIIILIACYCLFWILERYQGVLHITISDNCLDVKELFFIMPDNDWGAFTRAVKTMLDMEAEKALASCKICLKSLDDGKEYVPNKSFKEGDHSDCTEFVFDFHDHWKAEKSLHIPAGDYLLSFEQEHFEGVGQNPFEGRPLKCIFWTNRKYLRPWLKRLKQENIKFIRRGKGWNKDSLYTLPSSKEVDLPKTNP